MNMPSSSSSSFPFLGFIPAAPVEVPAGMKPKKGKDDDDDDGMFMGGGGKKGKKKGGGGGGGGAPAAPKAQKMSFTPENIGYFGKLELTMPATTAECPELYEKLVAKREWLKTAPPKPKKEPKKKEEKKEGDAKGDGKKENGGASSGGYDATTGMTEEEKKEGDAKGDG